jgi:HD-like signal output (HDOD) protein
MGQVHINKLKPGMVLDEEVRDINGRLLLKRDKEIQSAHIRIFKIWGITEVNIRGNNGSKDASASPANPELVEKIKENTHNLFRHVDLEHPAIKEIFRISVLFRSKYNLSEKENTIRLSEADTRKRTVESDFLQKLAMENITLPEIPSIVFELNEVIANPLSSAEDIAQVVHRSPSLTALLLKIVNSPFYGFPSKIDKISLAVTLIGTILYSYFPEESLNILSRAQSSDTLLYLQENDHLGCNHTHVVKHLLQHWKLPMVLENNVFFHHSPREAPQPVPATLVHLADIITNGLGIGTSGERFVPPLDHAAWESLGLSPTCFDVVVKQATHQFFALESMLEI